LGGLACGATGGPSLLRPAGHRRTLSSDFPAAAAAVAAAAAAVVLPAPAPVDEAVEEEHRRRLGAWVESQLRQAVERKVRCDISLD